MHMFRGYAVALLAFAQLSFAQPQPEKFDVGGHSLEMIRGGKGEPAVVFEAGMTKDINAFLPLAPRINEFTSTVCYSRAGAGKSDTAVYERTPEAVAKELHVLLQRANVPPPYVLVGHSLGGFYIRAFAAQYPTEVVAMVFVDTSSEKFSLDWSPEQRAKQEQDRATRTGTPGLELRGAARIYDSGEFAPKAPLPDVPVAIITATGPRPSNGAESSEASIKLGQKKRRLHAEFVMQFSNARHYVTNQSGHQVMTDQPDLVIEAVRWAVDASRAGATSR